MKGLRIGNEPSRETVISASHTSSFIPSDKWYFQGLVVFIDSPIVSALV